MGGRFSGKMALRSAVALKPGSLRLVRQAAAIMRGSAISTVSLPSILAVWCDAFILTTSSILSAIDKFPDERMGGGVLRDNLRAVIDIVGCYAVNGLGYSPAERAKMSANLQFSRVNTENVPDPSYEAGFFNMGKRKKWKKYK